jgi:hypothetical protein
MTLTEAFYYIFTSIIPLIVIIMATYNAWLLLVSISYKPKDFNDVFNCHIWSFDKSPSISASPKLTDRGGAPYFPIGLLLPFCTCCKPYS